MQLQSQFRSQIRAAGRKGGTAVQDGVNRAQRQFEREATAALRKAERDPASQVRASRPSVSYTVTERAYLDPIREFAVEQAQAHPEHRDVFLCHARDDREGAAKEMHNLLDSFASPPAWDGGGVRLDAWGTGRTSEVPLLDDSCWPCLISCMRVVLGNLRAAVHSANASESEWGN